ncbi:MAG: phosphatidate cytidylyltransferase [Kangiellaceae bacterium]|nr:phosphatidate cytidylyltransferase [Kangiellaceae bacterium]
MLKQRIITALALLPIVFLLLFKVPLDTFAGLIIIVVYLLALEWAKLSRIQEQIKRSLFALFISFLNIAIWTFSESLHVWPSLSWPHHIHFDIPLIFLFAAVVVIFVAFIIVLSFSKNNRWWQSQLLTLFFGVILLPALFIAFVSLRNIGYSMGNPNYGGSLLLFMLLMIWAADVGAFVTGKLIGKRKLTSVSPNKTWEGVLGGLALSVLVGLLGVSVLSLRVDNFVIYLAVIFSLAVVSVFGDLFESALKRVANIKDSGNMLPGHGGLLDRLDSTITVAPMFLLSFSYFEWFNG